MNDEEVRKFSDSCLVAPVGNVDAEDDYDLTVGDMFVVPEEEDEEPWVGNDLGWAVHSIVGDTVTCRILEYVDGPIPEYRNMPLGDVKRYIVSVP